MNITASKIALVLVAGVVSMGCAPPGDDEEIDDDDTADEAQALATPVADAPGQGEITFARAMDERIKGVTIKDQKHRDAKVAFSIALDDLSPTERLRVRGEVTLSRCNTKDIAGQSGDAGITPCDSQDMKRNPYDYAPSFSARFVLADAEDATDGQPLGAWSDQRCPENDHHCALALPEAGASDLPASSRKFVNLIVSADADGKNAKSWHVMEVEQHHGSLQVTRLGPGAEDRWQHKRTEIDRTPGEMGIDQTEDEGDHTQVERVVYQVKLSNLRPGDVIDVDAKMNAVLLGGFSCDPLVTGQILVSEKANATDAQKPADGVLGSRNGRNCSDHSNDGCTYRKSGALRLGNQTPSTMFVSYVAQAVRSCAAPGGGDRWKVGGGGGFLEVNVRR